MNYFLYLIIFISISISIFFIHCKKIDFFKHTDDLVYLNFKYNNDFIKKYKHILDYYLLTECFAGDYEDFTSIDPDISSLYIIGKLSKERGDKTFEFENKYYELKCIFTIKNTKLFTYELWNACSPILSRKQGYFLKLFKYFLTTIDLPKSEVVLYVESSEPDKMKTYEKIGFKYYSKTDEGHYMMKYIHI